MVTLDLGIYTMEEKRAVRHVETRRTSTCRFADRVAQISLEQVWHKVVPTAFRESQQSCLATIVAYDNSNDSLTVLAGGVGTKFLKEETLLSSPNDLNRVRDLHAEVVARRGFRKYLTEAMIQFLLDESGIEIRQSIILEQNRHIPCLFQIKDCISLHFYCSSSPCGNSVIKKFATLKKEIFRCDLPPQCWPTEEHTDTPGHSIPLGQFALLIKNDNSTNGNVVADARMKQRKRPRQSLKQKKWPINCETDWCPSGTTTVWSGKGSLHSCSDKVARWNYLGVQGSLLSSLFPRPMYIASFSVGRKLSAMTCRRAICCRLSGLSECGEYKLHHPSVMGTSVYLNENGVIDMSIHRPLGNDARFHSAESWVCWLQGSDQIVERIDGATGFLMPTSDSEASELSSQISSGALVRRFLILKKLMERPTDDVKESKKTADCNNMLFKLRDLLLLKKTLSVDYEKAKSHMFQHPVMREWMRREEYVPEA